MLERDADQQLNGRIELDDAYLGGQRRGGKRGRGAAGKTPFVAAVETTPEGKPVRLKLRRVTGFCNHAISGFAKRSLDPTCEVVSDGLACFAAVTDAGCRHQVIKTGSGPAAARTPARGEVPAPFALRLFLPEEWTRDAARLERAGVPGDRRTPRTKPEIALAEIGRAVAAGMRFGPVLADAGYGISATFRAGLSERGLHWAVGIPRILKVYPADVALLPPPPGRRRKLSEPDQISRPAEAVLAGVPWRGVTWRRGTKGRLSAHFAATRIRVADDPAQGIGAGDRRRGSAQGIGGRPAQHLPGEAAWAVGERRASGETKYYLCNLPSSAIFLCNLPSSAIFPPTPA